MEPLSAVGGYRGREGEGEREKKKGGLKKGEVRRKAL